MRNTQGIYRLQDEPWEYTLLIYPDAPVAERLREERDWLATSSDGDIVADGKPSITLVHFLAKEAMEETLIRWIQNICRMHPAFPIELNGYQWTPTQGLVLQIADPAPLNRLGKALKIVDSFVQSNDCPPLYIVPQPRLPLTPKVPQPLMDRLRPQLAARGFQARFAVEKLVLLKQDHASGSQRLVNTFTLTPSFGTE